MDLIAVLLSVEVAVEGLTESIYYVLVEAQGCRLLVLFCLIVKELDKHLLCK